MIFEVPVDHFPPLNPPTSKMKIQDSRSSKISIGSRYDQTVKKDMIEMHKKLRNSEKSGEKTLPSITVNTSRRDNIQSSSLKNHIANSVSREVSSFGNVHQNDYVNAVYHLWI
uniref:Ovule protein n=1 Tax=Caenorhabditis tropicalis TaxID=1561998 RepID=A0A1I7SZS6_9PELO